MMFEKATREKIRVSTAKGNLSVEQLWDLNLRQLDELAIALSNELENEKKKSFLTEVPAENKAKKLKFDIVLHILNVKKDERDARKEASEKKAKKDKLLAVLAEKEDQELRGKSAEEIRKELEALG